MNLRRDIERDMESSYIFYFLDFLKVYRGFIQALSDFEHFIRVQSRSQDFRPKTLVLRLFQLPPAIRLLTHAISDLSPICLLLVLRRVHRLGFSHFDFKSAAVD